MKKIISVLLAVTIVASTLFSQSFAYVSDDYIVLSASYFPDMVFAKTLDRLDYLFGNNCFSVNELTAEIKAAIRQMEQLSVYTDYADNTTVDENGLIYGARLGNYGKIYTTGDYLVTDDNSLVDALKTAISGDVIFISGDADIDLSELRATENIHLYVPEGVVLASDRGNNGSTGAKIKFSYYDEIMFTLAAGSTLSGICIEGTDGYEHQDTTYTKTTGIVADGSNISISNCEISGFNTSAITVKSGENINIENNYIHHIRGKGAGNAVNVISAMSVSITGNLFSNVRTAVYSAADNLEFLEVNENVDAGNTAGAVVKIAGDINNAQITHNTFYSKPVSLELTGDTDSLTVRGNIMNGYPDENYQSDFEEKNGENRADIKDNIIPVITSAVFCGDYCKTLSKLYEALGKLISSKTDAFNAIIEAITAYGDYDNYYEFKDILSTENCGKIYGAYLAADTNPIGGGAGNDNIIHGDYNVSTTGELKEALEKAVSGDVVFIDGNSVIDITMLMRNNETLVVGSGVTLASDRGKNRDDGSVSRGAVIISQQIAPGVFIYANEGSHITGLTVKGLDFTRRLSHYYRAFGENGYGGDYFYRMKNNRGIYVLGNNVEIRNCEIAGFSHAAILLSKETKDAYIHNCYIHHNRYFGLGYGICHDDGATSIIEYNLFSQNGHSIAGTGAEGTSYVARYNVDVYSCGEAHRFDMHGGSDRGDGTETAGKTIEMHNNTFLGSTAPYMKRGVPTEYSKFYQNISIVKLSKIDIDSLIGKKMTSKNNIWSYCSYSKVLNSENSGIAKLYVVKKIMRIMIAFSNIKVFFAGV